MRQNSEIKRIKNLCSLWIELTRQALYFIDNGKLLGYPKSRYRFILIFPVPGWEVEHRM